MKKIKFKGILYAAMSSATFGMIPLFSIPVMNDGLDSGMVIFYRLFFAAVLMGIIGLLQKKDFRVSASNLLSIFGFGCLYVFTANVLLVSYKFIDSGLATTIHFLYPIVVTMIMVLFYKERFTPVVSIAALLAVLGVALMSLGSGTSFNIKGILIALSTAFSYAFYIVRVNRSKAARIDIVVFTFYVLASGALLSIVISGVAGNIHSIPSWHSFFNLMLLALLATVISNFTLVKAVREVGSTVTSILGAMEPLTAITVGVLVFGELFGWNSLFGVVLILLSVYMIIRRSKG